MRALLRSMRPDNFEDISAVGALYRPGPMGANAHNEYADRKNGRKPVVPIHPELAEPLADILGDTYGLIVYQEQVMAIAQKLAGYSPGMADLLRRAMGKKKKEILDKEFEPFAAGMRGNGYSDAAIKTLWDILGPVLRLRLQQGAQRRLRAGLLLDRLPQGQLPGRVHGGAAHVGRR
jgi:DNA polymerase-3 subunit alpha